MLAVITVLIPRTERPAPGRRSSARDPSLIVPAEAIDAQSLIAYSDLVVSAGGTMNREAVALGVRVLTIFSGRMGAVDERLIADGRLGELRDPDDLELRKRDRRARAGRPPRPGDPRRRRAWRRPGRTDAGDDRRTVRVRGRRRDRLAAGAGGRGLRVADRRHRPAERAQPPRRPDAAPVGDRDPDRGLRLRRDLPALGRPDPGDPARRGRDRDGRDGRRHLRPAAARQAARPDRRGDHPGHGRRHRRRLHAAVLRRRRSRRDRARSSCRSSATSTSASSAP